MTDRKVKGARSAVDDFVFDDDGLLAHPGTPTRLTFMSVMGGLSGKPETRAVRAATDDVVNMAGDHYGREFQGLLIEEFSRA